MRMSKRKKSVPSDTVRFRKPRQAIILLARIVPHAESQSIARSDPVDGILMVMIEFARIAARGTSCRGQLGFIFFPSQVEFLFWLSTFLR